MEHTSRLSLKIKTFAGRYGFFILSLGYLLLAFKLLPDYGLGFDSPKNFDEGRVNLNYFLTGNNTPQDQMLIVYQIHGAFFFMISEFLKRVLGDTLGWLDPVSARHVFLPVLLFFFMNLYYSFLRKRSENRTAFLACTILLFTPSFWGHTFNNIKDIPLFIFFSLAIFGFYEWRASGFRRPDYFYGACIAWGLALISKFYAFLVPAILVLWLIVLKLRPDGLTGPELPHRGNPWTSKNLLHTLLGSALILILLALFFMPAIYAIKEKMIFLEIKLQTARKLMNHGTRGWSFFPWILVFYAIPVLTLATAAVGLVRTTFKKPLTDLSALMLIWFWVILLVACTPLFPVYNGMRLFMVFLVPFCFFAAAGVTCAAEFIGRVSPLKKNWGSWILGLMLIAVQIAGIVETHPYETTFFNRLAGGLKGAQEKNIPDASDYWLTSYREAVRWINENALPNAILWIPSSDGFYMIRHYSFRKDLKFSFVKRVPLPKNSFLLMTRGKTCWVNAPQEMRKNIVQEAGKMAKAYEIKRQGGEILTIYYKA